MNNISITTDFGLKDGNTGVMKGVIYGICPDAKIVDITHLIEPQNVLQAGLVLARQVFYFPQNSVHVVVVDPGVGTIRRPIAARIGTQLFVGPDNGFLTPAYEHAEKEGWPIKIVHTDKPEYWLPQISDIFHGRDIFAPVGAHLAAGVALESLGPVVNDAVRIDLPRVQCDGDVVSGEIVHIDHFGNLVSNIHREDLDDFNNASVEFHELRFDQISRTFGERAAGSLMALYCSTGFLMVSKVNGNAHEDLKCDVGSVIIVSNG